MAESDMEDPVEPDPAEVPEGEADRPEPAEGEPPAEPAEGDGPSEDQPREGPKEPAPPEDGPAPEEPLPPEQPPEAPPEEPTRGDPDAPAETVVSVDDDLGPETPEGSPEGQAAPPPRQGPPPEELEASLNELAETLTHLSKSIEEIKAFRDEMESRLSDVEERMVRLGSLAEAVSMQYNPFLEEDGHDPSEPTGAPRRTDDGGEPTTRPDPAEPQDPPADPEPGEANPSTGEPAAERSSSEDPLERRMLMMEWVKFLIERVGRVRLLDLLEYYEELGWLDEPEKETIMKVAVGVDGPDRVEDADWKGDRELHERSLIALERLRGRDVTSQTIDSLHLDLDRLFGG